MDQARDMEAIFPFHENTQNLLVVCIIRDVLTHPPDILGCPSERHPVNFFYGLLMPTSHNR
jgi:hypothetical protein